MKILLATEPGSHGVLEQMEARPWPVTSEWEVLSVVEHSHMWTTSEVAEEAIGRAKAVVDSAVERLQAKGWKATGNTAYGDPKQIILEHAHAIAADFLVAGSHGTSAASSALTRFMMGNVAASLLRYAPCSVEIVRALQPANSSAMKILLATDGSVYSELAAQSIAGRPWPTGTEVRVLSAVELQLPAARAFFEPPFLDAEYKESARAEALQRSQNAITAAVQILSSTGLTVSDSISVLVEPAKTIILQEAVEWGADLIVLGSHGHRGLERFLLGGVSEAVALHAGCSVEVIRKRES